jgi:hypothetical protein
MKKYILGFTGIVAFFITACGGGGSSSVSYDDPKIIENQDFFRVKKGEEGDFYIKELFDENNNTLYEGKYDETSHDLVPDTNETIPYYTDLSFVHIKYETPIRCRVVEDSNVSVQFWCLEENASGLLTLYTTRWKNLDAARENPE